MNRRGAALGRFGESRGELPFQTLNGIEAREVFVAAPFVGISCVGFGLAGKQIGQSPEAAGDPGASGLLAHSEAGRELRVGELLRPEAGPLLAGRQGRGQGVSDSVAELLELSQLFQALLL